MTTATTAFKGEQAPCGQIVDGERYQDADDECLVTEQWYYACGCRSTRHEYHDGSVCCRVVRHDGTVLADEFLAEHLP
jgi:hypothetical protein